MPGTARPESSNSSEEPEEEIAVVHDDEVLRDLYPEGLYWRKQEIGGERPSARAYHSALVFAADGKRDDSLVIFGGYGQGATKGSFYIIDTTTWESVLVSAGEFQAKTARLGHVAVRLSDSVMYCCGGFNGQNYLSGGFLLDYKHMKVLMESEEDRRMPPPRRDHTLTRLGQRLVLFGGWDCLRQFSRPWALDEHWKWAPLSTTGRSPPPRRGHTATTVGANMYLFGGLRGLTQFRNDMWRLDSSLEWTRVKTKGKRPSPRAFHSACQWGNGFIVFGGTSGRRSFYNDVWHFDVDTCEWRQLHSARSDFVAPGRCSASAVIVGGRYLQVFGGLGVLPDEQYRVEPAADLFVFDLGEARGTDDDLREHMPPEPQDDECDDELDLSNVPSMLPRPLECEKSAELSDLEPSDAEAQPSESSETTLKESTRTEEMPTESAQIESVHTEPVKSEPVESEPVCELMQEQEDPYITEAEAEDAGAMWNDFDDDVLSTSEEEDELPPPSAPVSPAKSGHNEDGHNEDGHIETDVSAQPIGGGHTDRTSVATVVDVVDGVQRMRLSQDALPRETPLLDLPPPLETQAESNSNDENNDSDEDNNNKMAPFGTDDDDDHVPLPPPSAPPSDFDTDSDYETVSEGGYSTGDSALEQDTDSGTSTDFASDEEPPLPPPPD
ncbi:MAG: hypothetical protein MHM6MM_006860, partial [Cercozoa sp. M6MM]